MIDEERRNDWFALLLRGSLRSFLHSASFISSSTINSSTKLNEIDWVDWKKLNLLNGNGSLTHQWNSNTFNSNQPSWWNWIVGLFPWAPTPSISISLSINLPIRKRRLMREKRLIGEGRLMLHGPHLFLQVS